MSLPDLVLGHGLFFFLTIQTHHCTFLSVIDSLTHYWSISKLTLSDQNNTSYKIQGPIVLWKASSLTQLERWSNSDSWQCGSSQSRDDPFLAAWLLFFWFPPPIISLKLSILFSRPSVFPTNFLSASLNLCFNFCFLLVPEIIVVLLSRPVLQGGSCCFV